MDNVIHIRQTHTQKLHADDCTTVWEYNQGLNLFKYFSLKARGRILHKINYTQEYTVCPNLMSIFKLIWD